MDQKCKSILIPEIGLELEPEFIRELVIGTDFSRVLAHLVVKTGDRSVMARGTSDGRLYVVAAGTSLEEYEVETGTAPDAYDAPNTYELVDAANITDILIEAENAVVQFRDQGGLWGDTKVVNVGFMSIDLVHYGIRIQNRVALAAADYEFTFYR